MESARIALRHVQIQFKYSMDRVAAIISLVALAPLFAAIGLAIKACDGGPVFFMQQRHGRDGRLFSMYKFRSMIVDADRYLDQHGRVTIANRVTWIGNILRRTSLDELPQLINIARGEMSFIGPRPLPPAHFGKLSAEQQGRFGMRPGLTGLAQINGRNTLKWSHRIAFDLQYVQQYSWLSDLRILRRTFRVVLLQEGIVLDRNPDQVDDLEKSHGVAERGDIKGTRRATDSREHVRRAA